MAMGFFQHLAGDRAVAWSGGSEPGVAVNPAAVAAMAKRGIDISKVNRPGFRRGSNPTEDEGCGCTEEVPRRAA